MTEAQAGQRMTGRGLLEREFSGVFELKCGFVHAWPGREHSHGVWGHILNGCSLLLEIGMTAWRGRIVACWG